MATKRNKKTAAKLAKTPAASRMSVRIPGPLAAALEAHAGVGIGLALVVAAQVGLADKAGFSKAIKAVQAARAGALA